MASHVASLQESFSTEELQKFDAGNVQVMSGEAFGRPEARLTIRYLSANGEHYLITHEYKGVVDNLSFERLFGKIIILQEMMARIAGDSDDRAVTGAVRAVSKVFIPLPI